MAEQATVSRVSQLSSRQYRAGDPLMQTLVARVHAGILDRGDKVEPGDIDRLRGLVEAAAPLCTAEEIHDLVQMVSQRLFGLGPLEPLLLNDAVSEVMANGPGPVWIERAGKLEQSDVALDDATLRLIVERIVAPLGLRADRTMPLVDARLPDGSRVHIAVPPLALDGPYLTIRKFASKPFTLDEFCDRPVAALLRRAVIEKKSMVISGGTGTGKTTLLNALAASVPLSERVITIEDAAELRLPGDHVVRLEARPANAEGVGEVTIRNLVRSALRMRPDRLIVGEVRGGEAFDMVQAMSTGHEGSLSTCHANSATEALQRLETMVLMSDVELPLEVARQQVRAAIDLVVHVGRRSRGRRRVVSVLRCHPDRVDSLVEDERLCAASSKVER